MRRGNANPWLTAAAILAGNAVGNLVAVEGLASSVPWLAKAFGPSLSPVTLTVPYLGAVTLGLRLQVTGAGLIGIAAALWWLRRRR